MKDNISDNECSCEEYDDCLHHAEFTEEEKRLLYEGLRDLYPYIPEKDIRLYIYGEPQTKKVEKNS